MFKLVEGAHKTWRRLDGHNPLPKIIRAVKFTDGCEVIAEPGDLQSQTTAAWSFRPSPKIGDGSEQAVRID